MRARSALFLLLLLSSTALIHFTLGSGSVQFLLTETYVLKNTGESEILLSEMDRAVSLFQNNSWQTAKIVEVDPAIEDILNDSDGNLYAVLEGPESLEGYSNFTITVVYEITSTSYEGPELKMEDAEDLTQIDLDLFSEYLESSGTWLTEDPGIRERAEEIASNETTVLAIVEALIEWITSNITYSSMEVPRYPNETLKDRKGDCDDQSILLITMCRTLGIPAYLQVGCVLSDSIKPQNVTVWEDHVEIHIEGVGWHGWSVVYIPPWGWLPVDLTYTGATNPRGRIEQAGIYRDYLILQQNISKYDYVGDSRKSREWIINSSLYIYLDERMVQLSGGEPFPVPWMFVIPLLVGSSIIIVFLYMRRRGAYREGAFLFF